MEREALSAAVLCLGVAGPCRPVGREGPRSGLVVRVSASLQVAGSSSACLVTVTVKIVTIGIVSLLFSLCFLPFSYSFFFLVCYFSKIKISISTPKKSLLRFSLFSPRNIHLNLLPSVLVRQLPWRLSSSVYPQNRYSTGSGSASHPQPPRATVSQP